MKERFEPSRLDVQAFARAGAELAGAWPQQSLSRLSAGLGAPLADEIAAPVQWSARGELRASAGAPSQIWLHLRASTSVWLTCQRCLAPLRQPLEVQRSFLFVPGEAEAERLDEDSEDDVLALTRSLDLAELAEDELILALPIVPRHDDCVQPLVALEDPLPGESTNPFAVLEALRTPGAGR